MKPRMSVPSCTSKQNLAEATLGIFRHVWLTMLTPQRNIREQLGWGLVVFSPSSRPESLPVMPLLFRRPVARPD